MPLFSKGDVVVCTNGHVICELVKDLNIGDMNWGTAFGNWTQPDPIGLLVVSQFENYPSNQSGGTDGRP